LNTSILWSQICVNSVHPPWFSEAERYFSSLSVTGAFVAGSGLEKNARNSAEKYDEIEI
jgi:hypothetical protein